MNFSKLKTKQLAALALALFMVVPMLCLVAPSAHATVNPLVSLMPSPSTAAPSGGAGSTTNIGALTVGSTLSVDIRADDYASVSLTPGYLGIDGVSAVVTWNTAVLTYVSYTPANLFTVQQNANVPPSSRTPNTLIIGALSADQSNPWETIDQASGVVVGTIQFTVASAGSTVITIGPQKGVSLLSAPTLVGGNPTATDVPNVGSANVLYNPQTTISLLQSPGDSTSTVTYAAGTDTIGQTFNLDIYINNPLQVNIWAWNLGVTWNPAALKLTGETEGSYMNPTGTTGTQGADTLFAVGYINQAAGDIPQGISDVYTDSPPSTANGLSGVLATLTFTVVGFANSAITLTPGIPTLQTISNVGGTWTPSTITGPITYNSAQYNTPTPPAPTSPVAKITNTDTSTTYTNGQVLSPAYNSGFAFDLSAANSVQGYDAVPNSADAGYPYYAVSGYSWTYTASAGAPALFTGPATTGTLSFTTPTVNSLTTYTVSLVVTAGSANPNDPAGYVYNPTSAAVTFQFQVQPASTPPTSAGPALDIYEVNPTTVTTTDPLYSPSGINGNPLAAGQDGASATGYTQNMYCDAFSPQAMMYLAGLVTFNGAPVANKEVTFNIVNNQGVTIGTLTALTNEAGIATVDTAIPWQDGGYSNPASEFGIWSVDGSVLVQQTIVTDNMPFDFGDIIALSNVQVASATLPRSVLNGPQTDQSFTVTLTGISSQTQNYWITYTVLDAGQVPVAKGLITGTMPAASYSETAGVLTVTASTTTATASFNIPSYAFVGGATIEVNIFNANPITSQSTAVPYCPAATGTFTIAIPFGQ
jgi:hypothetical protein